MQEKGTGLCLSLATKAETCSAGPSSSVGLGVAAATSALPCPRVQPRRPGVGPVVCLDGTGRSACRNRKRGLEIFHAGFCEPVLARVTRPARRTWLPTRGRQPERLGVARPLACLPFAFWQPWIWCDKRVHPNRFVCLGSDPGACKTALAFLAPAAAELPKSCLAPRDVYGGLSFNPILALLLLHRCAKGGC